MGVGAVLAFLRSAAQSVRTYRPDRPSASGACALAAISGIRGPAPALNFSPSACGSRHIVPAPQTVYSHPSVGSVGRAGRGVTRLHATTPTQPRFIDIAANLTDCVFRGVSWKGKTMHEDDFELMVQRFQTVGVEQVIVSGTSYDVCVRALELTRQYPGVFYTTIGVHPAHSLEFDESGDPQGHLDKLRKLITENRDVVVAIGEIGIDYAELEECPKDVQVKYFEEQLVLAKETGLPMFLHSREVGLDFVEILERNRDKLTTGVVHSFTGTAEELQRILDLGLYVSVNGASLRTAEQIEVVKTIPVERLMIETDSPWCDIRKGNFGFPDVQTKFPTSKKNKFRMGTCVERRNEPCHIVQIYEVLAAHHPAAQADPGGFAERLYQNTLDVFLPSLRPSGDETPDPDTAPESVMSPV